MDDEQCNRPRDIVISVGCILITDSKHSKPTQEKAKSTFPSHLFHLDLDCSCSSRLGFSGYPCGDTQLIPDLKHPTSFLLSQPFCGSPGFPATRFWFPPWFIGSPPRSSTILRVSEWQPQLSFRHPHVMELVGPNTLQHSCDVQTSRPSSSSSRRASSCVTT